MADRHNADCSPDGALAGALRAVLGERLSAAEAVRDQHGRDESHHAPAAPDLVAFPDSTDEVAAIVRACAEARAPVIAFGAGTGLEGGVAACTGGVCIDTQRLDRIKAVRTDDMDATVEAGVRRKRLNQELRATGLFSTSGVH